jgi:hypothetical protein
VSAEASTRVTLFRSELRLLTSFVENMDLDTWSGRLLTKLENAIARLDGTAPTPRCTKVLDSKPDPQPARCRACGWQGTLTRTSPCPGCGQKLNPIFFVASPRESR